MAAVNARIVITLERDMSDESFAQFVNGVGAFIRSQNRIGNVQITVDGSGGTPPPPPGTVVEGRWVDMREGYLSLGKNELHDCCTSVDAGAIRIASVTPEPNLGFFGFDSLRTDGRLELTSFILGKRREDQRHMRERNLYGELQFWARDPDLAPLNDDQQFKCAMSITARRVKLYVPVEPLGVGAIEEPGPALPPEIARRLAGKAAGGL